MIAIRSACRKLLSRCQEKRKLVQPHFCLSDAVPSAPQWKDVNDDDLPAPRLLTVEEVEYLECLSLVQYQNTEVEKERLEFIIRFADSLHVVNTDNVEPMTHIFEDSCLHLRTDAVKHDINVKDILKNAKVTEEGYFVAPPGNVAFLDSTKQNSNEKYCKSVEAT